MSDFTMQVYLKAMKENDDLFERRSVSLKSEILEFLNDTPIIRNYVKADNSGSLKLTFSGIDLLLDSRERVVFHGKESLLEFDFFTINGGVEISILKVFFDTNGHVILGSASSTAQYDFVNDPICQELFEALIKSAYDKGIISI